ncbi:MAG: amidohydrolase [Candidatus Aminicenantes bacterium RBG_13_62_12]|nr:MAG: amidohydrolase [Candidatus Aminicenantes bacterium RBG_13_62_12]
MADIVILNARVWTGAASGPGAEAVAVKGERIIGVGTTEEMKKLAGKSTRLVDAGRGSLLPGLIDSHTHFLSGGFSLHSVQLRAASSREEFARLIAEKAGELGKGAWVLNGEWDHELFNPVELPRRDWIDALTPDNPVCVNRLDGHMALCNSLALRLAGVGRETVAPPGGEIVRDPRTGEPTGILKDTAMNLVYRVVPEPSFEEKLGAARLALRHAAEHGLTTVHDMADAGDFEVFQELLRKDELSCRVVVYIPVTEVDVLRRLRMKTPFGSPLLKLGGLKGFVDGSLGSGTAFFFEPYADDPSRSNRGLLHGQMFPEGIMEERLLAVDKAGLQAAVHAIGDRANALLLDMFERIEARNGGRDRRWRIEHAQHLRPEDIGRFGSMKVIASVQPYHASDDGRWAENKIGRERCRTAYAFKSLLEGGATLALGSDWTVAPLDPIQGLWAAVTRRTLDGKNPDGWYPEQRLSLEEALRGYTWNGAFAEFAEKDKGSIEVGKLADLTVLDRDLFALPPEDINTARVLMTVMNGRVVYEKE